MAYDHRPRALPVSSRLRTQRSPIDSRYMELKRAAARPLRSAGSRIRGASKKTVSYSELTDDEEDGLTFDEFASDLDQQTFFSEQSEHNDYSDVGKIINKHESQQKKRPYTDLREENDEEGEASCTPPKLIVKLKVGKTARPSYRDSPIQFQSSISYSVSKSMINSQMLKKNGIFPTKVGQSAQAMITCLTDTYRTHSTTVEKDSAGGKLLKNLAVETIQHIASYLANDSDVFNFRYSCRTAFASITSSVWRKRFLYKYDLASDLDTNEIAQKYEDRRRVMIQRPIFDLRTHSHLLDKRMQVALVTLQQKFLVILKDLLIESNNYSEIDAKGNTVVQGKNLQVIANMISNPHSQSYVDIVDAIFCTSWDRNVSSIDLRTKVVNANENGGNVHVIQLCLAPYYLSPSVKYRQRHFDVSQFHVYSHIQPVFIGSEKQAINARLLLHIINFFQFHLKAEEEGLLAHCYPNLQPEQYPHPWIGTIKDGIQPLARHWKGIYTNLTEQTLAKLRSWDGEKHIFAADHLDTNDTFQDISFFFDETQERPWPKKWEDALCSNTFKKLSLSSDKLEKGKCFRPDIKEFWGTSRRCETSGRNGHFFGRIHSMRPQYGIHGFQRVTLMKFDALDINGVDTYDGLNVWAYEGCVFPGGTIIAGRWWNPRKKWDEKTSFGGPFLWWNVDSPATSMPIEPEEALEFQETFFEQVYGLH